MASVYRILNRGVACHKYFKNLDYICTNIFNYTSQRNFIKVPSEPHPNLDLPQVENDHFYKFLASNKQYTKTIAFFDWIYERDDPANVEEILNSDLSDKSAFILVKYLKSLLHSCKDTPELLQHPNVPTLLDHLRNKLPNLIDENLINLLKVLSLWPNQETDQRFYDICKAIDQEAVRRIYSFGYDTILLIMDHFYRLRVLRYSEFVWKSMQRLWRSPGKLTAQQVVHAMFLVNANRKWHVSVVLPDVEEVLFFYVYDLSLEETAILALSFFKTRTTVKNVNLVETMYTKLDGCVDTLDSITLSAYLKFFRLCTHYWIRHRMRNLLDQLVNRVDDLSITCCTHIALLGTHNKILHPECLQKVCERFYNEMPSARLKDLERLTLVLEMLNFTPNTEGDIFKRIIEELHTREREISTYHRVFLSTVYYLCVRGYHDYELIDKALSTSFLKAALGDISKYKIPRDTFYVSASVKLECPDYKGNFLDDELVQKLSQFYSQRLPSDTSKKVRGVDAVSLSIVNILTRIFNSPESVLLTYVLPYTFRPDVIFCLKDGNPLAIPTNMRSKNYLPLTQPPDIGGTWYAFNILDSNTSMADTYEPVGYLVAKLRHLKILGYKCALVEDSKWQNLEIDKMEYLKKLISAAE